MRARQFVGQSTRFNVTSLGPIALACLLAACGSHSDPSGESSKPVTEKPADTALEDVTFHMEAEIGPGIETQRCVQVKMPDDRGPIAVPAAESHYTPGSHHFLVYRTGQTEIAEGQGTIHECGTTEMVAGLQGTYYEAQVPDEERSLPKGVAHVFQPGEVLLLTSHYVNTKDESVDATVDFVLHTVEADSIEHEAGSIFFYNPIILIPPHSEVTVSRTCPISEEMNLALLWSHMHERGVDFQARTDDASVIDAVGDLYDTQTWSEPPARTFPNDPPVLIHKGANITYRCKYKNDTADTIVSGQSAKTNEMCILHGMYWPRMDSSIEECVTGVSEIL